MNARADKSPENKSKAVAANLPEQKRDGGHAFQFADNRPETVAQRKLQETVNGELGTEQLKSAEAPAQRKRERKDEKKSPSAQMQSAGPLQMAVDHTVPFGTKIVIDNPGASDFGDTGTIIRASRTERNCMAVEFDNEKGTLYRVYYHEMSPLATSEIGADAGSPATYSIIARHGGTDIIIKGTFDLTASAAQYISFSAENQGKMIGMLSVQSAGERGFILTKIETQIGPENLRVKGMGTVLMKIAATMSLKFKQQAITLAATKEKEKHPAPFYQKFGFKTNEGFEQLGELAGLLESMGDPVVNMTGNASEVNQSTGDYITMHGWTLGGWRPA